MPCHGGCRFHPLREQVPQPKSDHLVSGGTVACVSPVIVSAFASMPGHIGNRYEGERSARSIGCGRRARGLNEVPAHHAHTAVRCPGEMRVCAERQ